MALTRQQQDLIDSLKLSGIGKDEIMAIMLPLSKSKEKMEKMLDYLIANYQKGKRLSVDDVMGKMFQITGMSKA